MPGIFFHMAQARMLTDNLNRLRIVYPFMKTTGWEDLLTAGVILPDCGSHKARTHFWDSRDNGNAVIAPDTGRFISHYPDYIEDPLLTGVLLHLYLDQYYFTQYLPKIVTFTDDRGIPQDKISRITKAVLSGSGETMPAARFFTRDCMYGDYIRMNPYYVRKYDLHFPDLKALPSERLTYREASPDDYDAFRAKSLEELECPLKDLPMTVFDPEDFETMLSRTLSAFMITRL